MSTQEAKEIRSLLERITLMFEEYKRDKTLRHCLLKEIISIYQEGEQLLYPKTLEALKFTCYGLLAKKNRTKKFYIELTDEDNQRIYLDNTKPSELFDKLVKYYRKWELVEDKIDEVMDKLLDF